MKIFLSVASLKLSYGGPAISVRDLAAALAKLGHRVALWTRDGSAESVKDALHGVTASSGSLSEALADFGLPDLIHDNGIWWQHNHHIASLSLRNSLPRVVSTRGMLSPWALQHKPLRKRAAWLLYQKRDLMSAQSLHVTSDEERDWVKKQVSSMAIANIPNGVSIPRSEHSGLKLSGTTEQKTALYLGRLHPIKGLEALLEAWSITKPVNWTLTIAGPDEGGYRHQLEGEAARLGIAGSVKFTGLVEGNVKIELFRNSHLFVLPSHSESFGMAVGEALAYGLPVLTTKGVPWPDLEFRNCGWRVANTVRDLSSALEVATNVSINELSDMGCRGRQLISEKYGWDVVASRFEELYERVVFQKKLQA